MAHVGGCCRTNGTGQVEGLLAEQIDHFYYLHDVLDAGVPQLSEMVVCGQAQVLGNHTDRAKYHVIPVCTAAAPA